MRVLILAEHNNQTLNPQTLHVVTAARALTGDAETGTICVVVVGANCRDVAQAACTIEGVDRVLHVDDPLYAHLLAETVAPLLVKLANDFDVLMAPSTTTGKNIMPRVAALLDVQQVSDICAVLDAQTFKRPTYAGNAIATVKSLDTKKVLTIRSTAFDAAPFHTTEASIEEVPAVAAPLSATFVKAELTQSSRPELNSARVIVAGGRALGAAKNFHLLEALADKLDGAVGASRAAVDAGFAPNDYQIGQTGKIVAPELYIAVGISGAIQHLAGMKDSRIICAINKDEDAPIFQIADYGLVADLFDVLPELTNALDE